MVAVPDAGAVALAQASGQLHLNAKAIAPYNKTPWQLCPSQRTKAPGWAGCVQQRAGFFRDHRDLVFGAGQVFPACTATTDRRFAWSFCSHGKSFILLLAEGLFTHLHLLRHRSTSVFMCHYGRYGRSQLLGSCSLS